ncbi:MAG: sigma-54 dependent transcriptional regulator [Verrucomicrobiota bacterium]
MAKILIVDDERSVLELISQLCRSMGHEVEGALDGPQALEAMSRMGPDLMVVDLRIPGMSGLDLIKRCRQERPETALIMVTGHGSVETAVEAMRLGAFDYVTKPFELSDLKAAITGALKSVGKQTETIPAQAPVPGEKFGNLMPSSRAFVAESAQMTQIDEMLDKVASLEKPVLIEGEFGTGKQLVARILHNRSDRAEQPFKIIHCSSLPEHLLEQEFFSMDQRQSIFTRAANGTVFVEEIHLLPPRLQSQLDTFLEDIENRRLNGALPEELNFRLVASTSESMEALIEKGEFRRDLYYKLSVVPIQVPPLRHRREDVLPLANHFLANYSKIHPNAPKEIDKYASELLQTYSWSGNVGELQNAIERASALSDGKRIRPADLPPKVTQKVEVSDDENAALKHQLPIGQPLSNFTKKMEKLFIQETLKYNEGSREKTASMLDVSIATLYRKMGIKLEKEKK